jgi:Big-like domain-containing protein/PKD domain-containing protein
MLQVPMLPFCRRVVFGLGVAALALAIGCEKVPLLAPTGSTITLTATTTAMSANGTTVIIGQVLENPGTPPHSGTHISFTTTLGRIEPPEVETDVNGRVSTTFIAGGANGTATINALSGGATTGANPLKILVGTAAVGSVAVTANPNPVAANGGSTTVTARVVDVNGNSLVGTPVSFTTTAGALSLNVAATDANGAATSVLTTSVQATVTATVGAQGATPTTTTPPAGGGNGQAPTPASSGQASGSVVVAVAGAPQLTIAAPATALSAGVAAAFTFTVTPDKTNPSPIRSVTVNWGDGSAIQDLGALTGGTQVFHTYRSTGTYMITGTVVDSFGTTVSASTSVVVNPRPQPKVTLTGPTTTPTAGADTVFTGSVAPADNSGSVIQDVAMDYGDGTIQPLGAITGTAIALHHVYLTGGTYTAALTATDSNGGVGKSATSVFVQAATPLGVSLTSSQSPSGLNTNVTFTATVVGLGNAVVVNYHWVLRPPDEANTSTNQLTRTYVAGSASFTAFVTITTSDGRTATGSTVITP